MCTLPRPGPYAAGRLHRSLVPDGKFGRALHVLLLPDLDLGTVNNQGPARRVSKIEFARVRKQTVGRLLCAGSLVVDFGDDRGTGYARSAGA